MQISDKGMTGALSAVAGYVDTAGFIALFGLFTAHVTGNLVAVVGLTDNPMPAGAAARLAMIPVFMAAVGATSALARAVRRRGDEALPRLLAAMAMALGAFCLAGGALQGWSRGHRDPDDVVVIAAIGTAAMAVQNTIMRDAFKRSAPTTLMTGNLTTFTIQLMDVLLPIRRGDRGARMRARRQLWDCAVPLAGFVTGALGGGLMTNLVGLWSIAVPAATTGVLAAVRWHSNDRPVAAPRARETDRKRRDEDLQLSVGRSEAASEALLGPLPLRTY